MNLALDLIIHKSYPLHNYNIELITHSLNVAKISKRIAKRMCLTEKEIEIVYEAGLMHDVGKLKIPDKILLKPGKFSPREKNIMDLHPIYSEELILELLQNTKQNIQIAKIAKHHHENWDGKGYPDGLKGTEIPLLSRIITIADIFDALTQPRVYRKKPILNPLLIMEKDVGKKIDPHIFKKYALNELKKLVK